MCVCVRVAVSPKGLPGYGLAAGELQSRHRGDYNVSRRTSPQLWVQMYPLGALATGQPGPANRAYRSPRRARTAMARRVHTGHSFGNACLNTHLDCGLDRVVWEKIFYVF